MARFALISTNFSSGEIDPLLRARIDLNQYQNGAETLRNVVAQPQGGVTRRPGSKLVYRLPAVATPEDGTRMVSFEYDVDTSYMLVFTHQRMYVFKDGELIPNINGSGDAYLALTTVTSTVLSNLCWTQSANTLILTQQTINPVSILRGGTDATWTASNITFASIPKYAFTIATSNPAASITPSGAEGSITITASASVFSAGNVSQYINASPQGRARIVSFISGTQIEVVTEIPFFNFDGDPALEGTAAAGGASTITLDATASADNDAYNNYSVTLTGGTGSGQSRRISDYVGSTKVATVSVAWTTNPDATSTYSVTKSSIVANSWELETGYESVWSVTRGWPRTCTFHEGRLFFGGSTQRPSTVWGSKVAQFYDFEPDQTYDDDSIEATLDTNTLNVITDIISGNDLQIFTTGGEFYVPQEGLQPITPNSFFVKTVSRNGSREGIRVKQLQSGTLYIQRQGKSLNEFAYSDVTLSYVSTSISLLSSHLITDPIELALRKTTSTDESDQLYVLNGTGTMAVYSLLRSQNVVAPTRFLTDGEYKDVGVDIEDVYTVVKRTFDGTDYYFVELFVKERLTDCAVTGGAASGAVSLYYEGEAVQVICDGSPQGTETVASGAITFNRPSVTDYEVGLPIDVYIKTLPLEPRLSIGPRIGFKKRIVEINAILYETQNIIINDNLVPIRALNAPLLDIPVPEFTGTKVLNGVLGYSDQAQITVSQNQPLKLTLLGLEYKMATSGGS